MVKTPFGLKNFIFEDGKRPVCKIELKGKGKDNYSLFKEDFVKKLKITKEC